jgi:hypothetical protein
MSKDKEQKGKNAVLVIAVGKHPKMGPGERKPKGVKVKKADEKKSKSQMRRERKAAKAAKREGNGGEQQTAVQRGVANTRDEKMKREGVRRFNQMKESADPSQVREYVERRKISLKELGDHMGVEQNDLENLNVDQEAFQSAINELAGGRAKTYSERQEAKKEYVENATLADLTSKFSLGDRGGGGRTAEKRPDPHPTGLSAAVRQAIADKLGVNRSDIRENSPMLEGRKQDLHDAMAELGSSAYRHRRSRGEQRSKDYHDRKESREGKKSRGGQSIHYTSGYDPEVLERIAATRGISVEQLYDMITGQGGGDEEELNPRGDASEGEDSQMRNAPSSVFTTPYATREGAGFKSGSMRNPGGRNDDAGGERGSSFKPGQTVEDTMHGFKAPTSYGLARVGEYHMQPDEEQNMDEVQEMMNQKAEPMDLAFRLLKESMCKGDGCDGCKNCKTCAKCKPKGSTCEKMGC